MQIAGFIFGKNTAAGAEGSEKVAMTTPVQVQVKEGSAGSEKIAMTAPVAAEMKGDGSYKVCWQIYCTKLGKVHNMSARPCHPIYATHGCGMLFVYICGN